MSGIRGRFVRFGAAATAAVALGLAGCAGSGEAITAELAEDPVPALEEIYPGFVEYIDWLLGSDMASDFHRQVLEDYWVTDAELAESLQMHLDCLREAVPEVVFVPEPGPQGLHLTMVYVDGVYEDLSPEQRQALDAVGNDCFAPVAFIGVLHNEMRQNPQMLTLAERVYNCLDRAGEEWFSEITFAQLEYLIEHDTLVDLHPQAQDCYLDPNS